MFITNEYLTNNDGIGCWRRIAKVKPGKHMPKYVFPGCTRTGRIRPYVSEDKELTDQSLS
jgi:hypothetical protein